MCGRYSLKEIDIPEGVTEIGNGAISKCHNLEILNIPDSVEKFGFKCFSETKWIENIPVNEDGLKIYRDILLEATDIQENLVINPNINFIVGGVFQDFEKLESIVLPNNIKCIEEYTFQNCINLESIEISSGVNWIGRSAFYNCKSLKGILIPDSVREIYESTFENCEKLSEIKLPTELEYIGELAFGGCSSLKKIIIPKYVKWIEAGAFGSCTNLEDVKFEGNPEYIGSSFYGTKYYKEIEEDEYGCKYVQTHIVGFVDKGKKEIIIKEGTVSIADNVFSEVAFKKVIFPKELKYIGDFAFAFCKNLRRVELP